MYPSFLPPPGSCPSFLTTYNGAPPQPQLYRELPKVGTSYLAIRRTIPQQLILANVQQQKIMSIYRNFVRTGDLAQLPFAIDSLAQLEAIYSSLWRDDPIAAENMQPCMTLARQIVATINFSSPTLTKVDGKVFQTFFKRPVERVYVDLTTRYRYVQPDHSHLMGIGGHLLSQGGYGGFAVSRRVRCQSDRICDVISLKKRQEQIDFESGSCFKSFVCQGIVRLCSKMEPDGEITMQKVISTQIRLLSDFVQNKYRDCQYWGYEGLEFCTPAQLEEYFGNRQRVLENHAILFFYQRIIPDACLLESDDEDLEEVGQKGLLEING